MCRKLLLPTALIALMAGCSTAPPIVDTISGKVTKVHDGDSIHITPPGQKRVKVRLTGIDAPELEQPFGVASRDLLRSKLLDRMAEARCHKTDKYRRQVCVVYLNGADVNLQMVKAGLAWHYKHYQQEQPWKDRRAYAKAENSARREGLKIWSKNSIAPWEFRKQY